MKYFNIFESEFVIASSDIEMQPPHGFAKKKILMTTPDFHLDCQKLRDVTSDVMKIVFFPK